MRNTFIHWMWLKTIMRMLMKVICTCRCGHYLPKLTGIVVPYKWPPGKCIDKTGGLYNCPTFNACQCTYWCELAGAPTFTHKINIGETTFSRTQLIMADNVCPWLTGSLHTSIIIQKHKVKFIANYVTVELSWRMIWQGTWVLNCNCLMTIQVINMVEYEWHWQAKFVYDS